MKKRIHVNQHIIKANKKNGTNEPPLTVKTYKDNTRANEVEILGPSKLVYSPDKPLSCGATVWVETDEHMEACAGRGEAAQPGGAGIFMSTHPMNRAEA